MVVLAAPALAGVSMMDLGTTAPPSLMGGYTLEGFNDLAALGDWVTSVAPPSGATAVGDLEFDTSMEHWRVGSGWDTWSHAYTGDVYWFDEMVDGNMLTLTLPVGTMAFRFYLEPDYFGTASFAVMAGGEILGIDVEGRGGARGVGIYSDDPLDPLTSIVIEKMSVDFSNGFGIGEFAIDGTSIIPEGSGVAWMLGGLVAGAMALRRRAGVGR